MPDTTPYVLAFDTANEVIAIGIGQLVPEQRLVRMTVDFKIAAHRASNTQLIPRIQQVMAEQGIHRHQLACIACGRGPGSFTGVRIAMATAKGIASALELPLIGLSTLDTVAWGAWSTGIRGALLVIGDAMRREVYPVRYGLNDTGIDRLEADRAVKADIAAEELPPADNAAPLQITGDALSKYQDLFAPKGMILPDSSWTPTGRGLLLALQSAWQHDEADPFDRVRHNPAFALPVYTRLSDAEEHERTRLSRTETKNLTSGVQGAATSSPTRTEPASSDAGSPSTPGAPAKDGTEAEPSSHGAPIADATQAKASSQTRKTMHNQAILASPPDRDGMVYQPLDQSHAADVAALESALMGSDAWDEAQVLDELPRPDRTWWAAYHRNPNDHSRGSGDTRPSRSDEMLVGYAGGWIVDGELQILKVGVDPAWQHRGIARHLLGRVAEDARNLAASRSSLEVRASNEGAQAFYRTLGYQSVGTRPHYYSDREDAVIMQGPLPLLAHDVAGMTLQVDHASLDNHPTEATFDGASAAPSHERPLILAIESSCDETAAAIVNGAGQLISDVVASQVDFHARFGGVVPEIASRKHIEAICGVCDECLERAHVHHWSELDAIAVTYAPGLVGALVVGVAFAKGAAWACDVPYIGVNHLEGHLYANKLGDPYFAPPAIVSLVSGGNTMLVYMKDWGDYQTLGATIDDAVGEAFDKVAKALGLGYPGGPVISRYAAQGDPQAIPFPRAMLHSGDLRFSLSGLKTAVITYINQQREADVPLNIPDIAASFQQAVVDVQVAKAKTALEQTGAKTLCVGGGVAANPVLRQAYEDLCRQMDVHLILPPLSACGDNAGMIALVALDRFRQGKFFDLGSDAHAHADLDLPY